MAYREAKSTVGEAEKVKDGGEGKKSCKLEQDQYVLEDSQVLEQRDWPPSVQSSCIRPKEESKTIRREKTEKELKEFEQIEKSISDSGAFEHAASQKTKKDESL